MRTKQTTPFAIKTMTRNKLLVLVSLSLWCLMLIIGASCRTSAPVAPRTELAVAPGGCAPVTFSIPTGTPTSSPPWLPPMDVKGGAAAASLQDAAIFAWQEFIALNWPAVPQTGQPNTRDQPDSSKPFGTTTGPLVWHTFRHKSEIFPGTGQPPGYPNSSPPYYGYDAPPQYIYANGAIPSFASLSGPTPTPTGSPSPAPWINLDEMSEIGLDTMYAGKLSSANLPFPSQQILFLAKANRAEYTYVAANQWWDGSAPGPATAAYIANATASPASYAEPSPGSSQYVAFPNNTIEVKAAWRQLTAQEATSGRFYTTTVRYYNTSSGQIGYIDAGNNPNQGYPVWGLVALHIIQKTPTAPYFIYATFSQADNILDSNGNCIEDVNGNLVSGPCTSPSAATPAPTAPLEPNITSTPATSATPETLKTIQQLAPPYSPLKTAGQRLFYNNATAVPTPSPLITQGIVAVNQRQHNIPQCVIDVNTAVHAAITNYTNQNNNVWLYYKLINVQYQPYDKPAGTIYTGATGGPDPSTYYQANEVVETNFNLQVFSGQFQHDPNNNANLLNLITDYDSDSTSPFYGKPFKNVYYNMPPIVPTSSPTPSPNSGKAALMGGCMGCHGNAQVAGYDFSFILKNAPVNEPEVGTAPTSAAVPSAAGLAKFRKMAIKQH